MKRLASGALIIASLAACPKQDEPPEFDPSTDRALQKLRAEQERLAQETRQPAPPDPLTTAITSPVKPESLGVPKGVEADLGPLTLSLVGVEQSQTGGGGKVTLITSDRFVRVTLEAESKDGQPIEIDLSQATLAFGDQTFNVARDVQRASKAPLVVKVSPGSSQKFDVHFECPPEVITKGLKIILSRGESRVELALQ